MNRYSQEYQTAIARSVAAVMSIVSLFSDAVASEEFQEQTTIAEISPHVIISHKYLLTLHRVYGGSNNPATIRDGSKQVVWAFVPIVDGILTLKVTASVNSDDGEPSVELLVASRGQGIMKGFPDTGGESIIMKVPARYRNSLLDGIPVDVANTLFRVAKERNWKPSGGYSMGKSTHYVEWPEKERIPRKK